MPLEKYAEITRAMIFNENQIINYRMSWLMTLQGLLFAALGFSWDKANAKGLVGILAGIGILSSIGLLFDLSFANVAIRRLLDSWENYKDSTYSGPDVIGLPPHPRVPWPLSIWLILPIVFTSAWSIICWIKFYS